jgi:hypothetical protein
MSSQILSKSLQLYEELCKPRKIAEYYVLSELDNVLGAALAAGSTELKDSLAGYDDSKIWRLTEALAFTFRTNHIFNLVTDQGRDWYEVELPVEAITLGGVNQDINRITFSDDIGRNPVNFGRYLEQYFKSHKGSDPEKLAEFTPRMPLRHPLIIVGEKDEKIVTYDGIHRLMAQVLGGRVSIRAYMAVNNGQPHKSMVGDSVFMQLRMLYQSTQDKEKRRHILETTKLLAQSAINGERAIEDYWIGDGTTFKTRLEGEEILNDL